MGEEDLGVRDQRTEQTNKFKQDDGDDFIIEYGDDGLHWNRLYPVIHFGLVRNGHFPKMTMMLWTSKNKYIL